MWERWPGRLLYQKKVGLLGVGVIGEEIARKCKAFGMTVLGVDIVRRELDSVDSFYGPEDLLQVAGEVDYLILVAPSTPQTGKIVGGKVLDHRENLDEPVAPEFHVLLAEVDPSVVIPPVNSLCGDGEFRITAEGRDLDHRTAQERPPVRHQDGNADGDDL